MTTPVIDARGLTKRYGEVTAVDEVSLRIEAGEIYALLGLNGAGKTTTIRMLLGMVRPTSSSVAVLGAAVRPGMHEVWRRVGYLVETPTAYPELTVEENLAVAAFVLSEVAGSLRRAGTLLDGPVDQLDRHDRLHRTDLLPTLTAYLDSFDDVAAAASHLHIHPNTFRNRLRRITELTGFDAADAGRTFPGRAAASSLSLAHGHVVTSACAAGSALSARAFLICIIRNLSQCASTMGQIARGGTRTLDIGVGTRGECFHRLVRGHCEEHRGLLRGGAPMCCGTGKAWAC